MPWSGDFAGLRAAWLFGAVALVGAGAGVGLATAGTLDVVGDGSVLASADRVSFHDCPGGTPLGDLQRGDRVLVTARDAEGQWVEVRSPDDLGARVWVQASYVTPDENLEGMPVGDCIGGEAAARDETTTTTTTATTTVPTTAPPGGTGDGSGDETGGGGGGDGGGDSDAQGPAIGAIAAVPGSIEENGSNLPCDPTVSSISVPVTDPSGVAAVTIAWEVAAQRGSKPMAVSGNTATTSVGEFPDDTIPPGTRAFVTLTVTARDQAGNASTRSSNNALELVDCTFG